MAIELTGIVVKHERRLRLVFSNSLAAGAFGSPAPPYYVVENQDGHGPSPSVSAAIIVSGATSNVELALDVDLVAGALYRVTAIGVPAVDASTSTAASDEKFRFGTPAQPANVEPKVSDADLLFYGRDLVWFDGDYLETVEADLATVSGISNARAALERRCLGSPLPWNPNYSPRARHFVDGTLPAVGGLKGRLQEQAIRDDRIRAISVRLVLDDTTPTDSLFEILPTFRSGATAGPISVPVPVI